ncbi:MAG: PaaI family thioesterase [Solirubrobacterales bacterium]
MNEPKLEMSRTSAASANHDLLGAMQQAAADGLVGALGIKVFQAKHGHLAARLELDDEHLGPHGFTHAGTVVALADSCAGLGCMASLPGHARGFMTLELKSNFLPSAKAGETLACHAELEHGGRTTQVWNATVRREYDCAPVALFRCTQILLTELRPASFAASGPLSTNQ